MAFLCDTNIIGEVMRPRPQLEVSTWFSQQDIVYLSVITVEEIYYGCGQWRGDFRRQGHARTQADLLIAATAEAHGLILVTRNTSDFEGCSLQLFNPFTQKV